MKTDKLYEKDAYLKEFSATVLCCAPAKGGFKTVLDKTCFFPEGGGQPCDKGSIENTPVFDVQIEDGTIYHYTEKPFIKGQTVRCEIDFARRFSFMQNHTGEHIVSGTVHKLFGFNNVGFTLNENGSTVDFDGEFSREDLLKIEKESNEKIYKCLSVNCFFPNEDEIKNLSYRSKREVEGPLRLVEIEDTDLCACCAPHVKNTGEIGIIKLLESEKMRGGTRVQIKCGSLALTDYNVKFENVSKIGELLSAKKDETAKATQNLFEKFNTEKQNNSALKRKVTELIIKSADKNRVLFFEDGFDIKELQLLADGLHKTYGGLKAVFSKSGNGYNFVMCESDEKLQEVLKSFKEKLNVRGGGRNGLVSGFAEAGKNEIEEFFKG